MKKNVVMITGLRSYIDELYFDMKILIVKGIRDDILEGKTDKIINEIAKNDIENVEDVREAIEHLLYKEVESKLEDRIRSYLEAEFENMVGDDIEDVIITDESYNNIYVCEGLSNNFVDYVYNYMDNNGDIDYLFDKTLDEITEEIIQEINKQLMRIITKDNKKDVKENGYKQSGPKPL